MASGNYHLRYSHRHAPERNSWFEVVPGWSGPANHYHIGAEESGVDTLPLNETAIQVLEERQKHRLSQCDNVFPSNNQTRMSNRNLFRAFGIAANRAKVDNFRFHDLRHTFATRLVQSGVGIYEVQRLGRWRNASMVMRYAHHNSESLRASIEVMDGFKVASITNLSQP